MGKPRFTSGGNDPEAVKSPPVSRWWDRIPSIVTAEYGQVPVLSEYPLYPFKDVLHTAITIIVSGALSVFLGIGHLVVACQKLGDEDGSFATGYPIWVGVVFVITGAVGLVSRSRPSRGRILAAAVLGCIAIFCSLCVLIHAVRSFFLYQTFDGLTPEDLAPPDYLPEYNPDDGSLPSIPTPPQGIGVKKWRYWWTLWFRWDGNGSWVLHRWIRHRFRMRHRPRRTSQIVQQMFEDPEYLGLTVGLLVAFVVIIFAGINLVTLAITTLQRGRGRGAGGKSIDIVIMRLMKQYLHVNIGVLISGTLSCLIGIGQTYAALTNIQTGLGPEFLFMVTGYPVWLGVVFVFTGIYGIRHCADENLLILGTLINPILSIITSAFIFGYSIRTLFYHKWNFYESSWQQMSDSRLYLWMIIILLFAYATIFVCGVLQIYFTVVIVRKKDADCCDDYPVPNVGKIKYKPPKGRMAIYKIDLND